MSIPKKIIVMACLVIVAASAEPLLVAVALPDHDAVQMWASLDIPTYEHIGNAAIAEIDGAVLSTLLDMGFTVTTIDVTPWNARYFIIEVPGEANALISNAVIWSQDDIVLLEISDTDYTAFRQLPYQLQPMYRIPIPARYWQSITETIVALPIEYDPFIQTIVDQVNTDTIMAFVQRLENFRTRLTHSDSSFAASQWIHDKYSSWGYMPTFDSFYVDSNMAAWGYWPDTGYERNVVATSNGTMTPSTQMIICGHHDAIVWWDTALARIHAPGADDNATGAVAAMEAARIFSNYSWEPTIKFITWGTEELGLYGSYHYAGMAESLGWDIGGVMNGDMIGYMDDANFDCIIQRRDSVSLWISELYAEAGQLYVPQLITYPAISGGGSDWYPFARAGYPSVGAAENDGTQWNPYYHDTTDKTSTITPALFTYITKAEIATLAILGIYPGLVENIAVLDMGNGSELEVSWDQAPETDVIGYRLFMGMQSHVYTDTFMINDPATIIDTLTGLMEDSIYYVAVTAVDADSHESYAAIEKTGMPRSLPQQPSGLIATPITAGIRIDWLPNQELDLAGYRVYRRINQDPTYDSLNILLLTDTTFTNAPLSGANRYYYAIRAFDTDGNPSPMSDEAYGRPVTLDQHILVIDETRNGGGPNPPDSLQNQFYEYVLQDYPFTEYEFGSEAERPVLADMVPYSTILWHADDYSQLMASDNVEDLTTYLGYGGNLWFVGWKPTGNLMDNISYPATYITGDFVRDYMNIGEVALSANSDSFQAAIGHLSYPGLDVDSTRVPSSSWGGTLRMIEAYLYSSPGEEVYTIDMKNNGSPFEGLTCGVRYLGPSYRTVLFGFPLYYMEIDDARAAAQKVMSDFGEVGIAEVDKGRGVISGIMLYQNTPNPFTHNTVITFQLPVTSNVELRVFNVLGQRVKTLAHGLHEPGVYSITWNGQDEQGRSIASGVYFCKLEVSDVTYIKKMILVR